MNDYNNKLEINKNILNTFELIYESEICSYDTFSLENKPQITIKKYIYRILKYFLKDIILLNIAIYYIFKFKQKTNIILNGYNIHMLLFISSVIVHKFFEDEHYHNKYLSKVGGLTCEEVNKLEILFLQNIDWELYIYSLDNCNMLLILEYLLQT